MSKTARRKTTDDILIDLLIVQCAAAGLNRASIRAIAGVDTNRVARILKHFKSEGKKNG
jgi:transposase-like protein